MTRIPVAGVIHTHDWDHEPGLRVDMHLREHLVNAHGIPASHWERWSFGAATEEHEDLHDRCPCTAEWIVAVGGREQAACGRHLNRVCSAMEGAEGRSGTRLTVRRAR